MRNHWKAWTLAGLSLSFLLIVGCEITPVQIGPQEKETITILHPGRPVVIERNYTVDARPLADQNAKPAKVDVGGWVAMPPDHWDAVQTRILKLQADIQALGDLSTKLAAATTQMNKNADRIKELEAELTREKVPVCVTPRGG